MKHQKIALLILCAVFLCTSPAVVATPRPIVVIHGIFSDKTEVAPVVAHIKKYLPGTYVKCLTFSTRFTSTFNNMHTQISKLIKEIKNDSQLQQGFNIIAHSQGGLLARGYIQRCNTPRVHNLITWGTPHRGVFGFPGTFDDAHPWLDALEPWMSSLAYTKLMQHCVSFANYWHDSLNSTSYQKYCRLLPKLNNEIAHATAKNYKKNITSLENFVMVNSTAETIIEPDASCHFGYYKDGSKTELELFLASTEYKCDRLGLKTLYDSGRLHFKIAHCFHTQYQEDELNFVENSLPFLTAPAA